MIERDHDNVVLAREVGAVKRDLTAGSVAISAAVQPNHDGAFAARAEAAGPDVQDQAVFTGRLLTIAGRDFGDQGRGSLGAAMAEVECVSDAGPNLGGDRREKSARAVGGGAVGDAFEGVHLVGRDAANFARIGGDDRARGRIGGAEPGFVQ
jgi:hypothetical protein